MQEVSSSSMLICNQSRQPYYLGTGAKISWNSSNQIIQVWLRSKPQATENRRVVL
jgi:hypothetical protein